MLGIKEHRDSFTVEGLTDMQIIMADEESLLLKRVRRLVFPILELSE